MARAPVLPALLCLAVLALAGGADARKMVGVYELKRGDFSVKMTNWGATIMSILVPDSKGIFIFFSLPQKTDKRSYFHAKKIIYGFMCDLSFLWRVRLTYLARIILQGIWPMLCWAKTPSLSML